MPKNHLKFKTQRYAVATVYQLPSFLIITALNHFKIKVTEDMAWHFFFDEDVESIYVFCEKNEGTTRCFSLDHCLSVNYYDSYDAVTQIMPFYEEEPSNQD